MVVRLPVHAIIIVCCLMVPMLTAGCTQASYPATPTELPDPEIGLVQWIDAVNRQDLNGLYDLLPFADRAVISRENFIALNQNSSLVTDRVSFTGYDIVKKESDGSHATLRVILHGKLPSVPISSSSYVPIAMNFNLTYEDGEWKIREMA